MQCYAVTLVRNAGSGPRPTLLVLFSPNALISAFQEELFKRTARQKFALNAETHEIELRLNSADGAILDPGDLLSDVVLEAATEKLFAIFSNRSSSAVLAVRSHSPPQEQTDPSASITTEGDLFRVRLITPSTAKQARTSLQLFPISTAATIKDLHEHAARHLKLNSKFEKGTVDNECNCVFSRNVSDAPPPASGFIVVSEKSSVEAFSLRNPTQTGVENALQDRFGVSILSRKKIHFHGATIGPDRSYSKVPVVAICSKARRTPTHAHAAELRNESEQDRSLVLDLHTSEIPINAAALNTTVSASVVQALCKDGVLELFAVSGWTTTSSRQLGAGKEPILRDRPHWQPARCQSARGAAMFLSTVRIVASLIQNMESEPAAQDAVFHMFDLFTGFPPAVRALFTLAQGKIPSPAECAALSHVVFHVLESSMPTELVGRDRKRLFEGARLFFGFLLEKARSVKITHSDATEPEACHPYLAAFSEVDGLRDHRTTEPVMHVVSTEEGLVKRNYFDAFADRGLLATNPLQPHLTEVNSDVTKTRLSLLSGGRHAEVIVFAVERLENSHQYPGAGNIHAVIDEAELADLEHMAELCGRNKLAVHKPSQLESAVSPCLAFDRNAHLAVYTGQQACGIPGQSSLIFRPLHGSETIDTAAIEHLIAPIIRTYEAAGTHVFDVFGGASLKSLQTPDEVFMFCVDVSASMADASDFSEANEASGPGDAEAEASEIIE